MKKSNAKDLVLEFITKNPGVDTKTITEKVEYGVDTVRRACATLVKEGIVNRDQVQIGSLRKFLFTPIVEEKTEEKVEKESLVAKAKKAAKESADIRNEKAPKNRDRVTFEGEDYGKAKLVKAVVASFTNANPSLSFKELAEKINFDADGRRVYPKYDVIRPITDELVKKSITGKYKRYYVNQIQTAGDGVQFVICREWGLDNTDSDFIDPIAKVQLGYTIDNFTK